MTETMNFVTCKLIGPSTIKGISNFGLANQMFQIATALSYGKDNNLEAIFPELLNDRFGPYADSIFRKLNKRSYKETEIDLDYVQPGFAYTQIPKSNKIRLSGYFQSEKFFSHNREYILDKFEPEKEVIQYIKKKYGKLLEDSISVHVRIGDYKNIQDHHPLISKTNYYKNVINKTKRKNIVVFSDDIKKTKKIKALRDGRVHYIEGESEIIDLFFMSMCADNAIVNSSFSWWGAWLNKNVDKIVYYPENWFGPAKSDYNTKDLIPSEWIKEESKKNLYFFN